MLNCAAQLNFEDRNSGSGRCPFHRKALSFSELVYMWVWEVPDKCWMNTQLCAVGSECSDAMAKKHARCFEFLTHGKEDSKS